MPTIIPRRPKPVSKLSDSELHRRILEATATIEALPDRPPHDQIDALRAKAKAAAASARTARDELNRRSAASEPEPTKSRRRGGTPMSPAAAALDQVARFNDPELAGVDLDASKLSKSDVDELRALTTARGEGELTDAQAGRWDALVGKAAGLDLPGRRAELAGEVRLAQLDKVARRHPQAESVLAAVMGDRVLGDHLRRRLRENVEVVDELGNTFLGASADPILEPLEISTLFVILAAIGDAGGRSVTVSEHGLIPDSDLPRLELSALTQLRRNRWIATHPEAAGWRISPGPRVRTIAAKWGIELPEEAAA